MKPQKALWDHVGVDYRIDLIPTITDPDKSVLPFMVFHGRTKILLGGKSHFKFYIFIRDDMIQLFLLCDRMPNW